MFDKLNAYLTVFYCLLILALLMTKEPPPICDFCGAVSEVVSVETKPSETPFVILILFTEE